MSTRMKLIMSDRPSCPDRRRRLIRNLPAALVLALLAACGANQPEQALQVEEDDVSNDVAAEPAAPAKTTVAPEPPTTSAPPTTGTTDPSTSQAPDRAALACAEAPSEFPGYEGLLDRCVVRPLTSATADLLERNGIVPGQGSVDKEGIAYFEDRNENYYEITTKNPANAGLYVAMTAFGDIGDPDFAAIQHIYVSFGVEESHLDVALTLRDDADIVHIQASGNLSGTTFSTGDLVEEEPEVRDVTDPNAATQLAVELTVQIVAAMEK